MLNFQTSLPAVRRTALALAACVCGLAFFASIAVAQDTGTLTGRFVYGGAAPELKEIVPDKDGHAFHEKIYDESLVVNKENKGIANVVIYVRSRDIPAPADLPEGMAAEAKMDNKNGRFTPRVLPLWLGKQEFVATNGDAVAHNCNVTLIGEPSGGGFNRQIAPGQSYKHTIQREQRLLCPVACNSHTWMKGFVLPRSNPFFAVTDENGEFTIEHLPPGEWEFQVLHEEAGFMEMGDWEDGRFKMTIKAGKNSLGDDVVVPPDVFVKD